ncbi:MAG: OmpA family protein [Ekhidna sp.]|nr:OmpA family protein [Ekhidna sp.]MBC6408846.1 OmpA family protein [Ekhidna sp.]MBC6427539.1 OmpA family protein [Ekhidna sp.]
MIRLIKYNVRFFLTFLSFFVFAQENKKEVQILTDSVPGDIVYNIYEFKGINKYPKYYNASQLKRINQFDRSEQWEAYYKELKRYVSKFGIQNFYTDTRLIWRLAKMTELFGDPEEAKTLYRMVLRHHYEGIDIKEIELYYDSLNRQATEQFVPIDYYYELVEHRKLIDTLRPPRGILLNMGMLVNSRSADYGPSLSINNDILLFTSKRELVDRSIAFKPDEDLYISKKDHYGTWSKASPIEDLNTNYNEGSPCISSNGKTLVFSRCFCPGVIGHCDLYISTLADDSTWTTPKNLGPTINSVTWDSHPALSRTGDTLFFASDRLGGFGLSDIYYSTKDEEGNWQPALNLGPVVNTRKNDLSPFYHPGHNVLYFSSDGQLYNFGEFDIYKAYNVNGYWTEPQNIGPLVNGRGSEFYFTIDSRSELLFYARSSSRDLDKQDIYSFPLPMGAQPEATTPVTGTLTDSLTGVPFKGIVSIIDLDRGQEVAPKFLKNDGSFAFNLVNNRNYLLILQGDDFFRIEEVFYLNGPLELNQVTEPIASKVKFESIKFDVGKSDLKTEMYADLNKIVNFLYDNLEFKLKISGHTDSVGDSDKNLQLSKDRAQVIEDYIVIFAGILKERVLSQGFGHTQPIVENELTEEDRELNRRVEFEIYREAPKTLDELEASGEGRDF